MSEGEGSIKTTKTDPLNFQDEVAHYYRFGEIYHDWVLTEANNPLGYASVPQSLGWTDRAFIRRLPIPRCTTFRAMRIDIRDKHGGAFGPRTGNRSLCRYRKHHRSRRRFCHACVRWRQSLSLFDYEFP